jgi:hypothetical protein
MMALPPVFGFEVCLHRADGTVSIIMAINAFGPYDAKLQASKMLNDDMPYAIIWQELIEVATVHRHKPN